MIEVGIVGASGYGGGELLRMLARHPEVTVRAAVSETNTGKPISAAFPGLRNLDALRFESYGDGSSVAQCDVVFLAQENGKAMHTAPHLLEAGCKVIDLSADFRFRDTALYPQWYSFTHPNPEWSARAVYGLPELYRESIQKAQLIGNPGCYPTASILALAPLVRHKLIEPTSIVIDAKSGVSGAGRSKYAQDYHFPEANESVSAYKIAGTHRHVPEIETALGELLGAPLTLTFTPHLIPMTRGILATCYATPLAETNIDNLRDLYALFYADAPFVHVLPEGTPATKHTLASNQCHIGIAVDQRANRIVVLSAIDNLVKGMAGQAIQNMNLLCGFEETTGLDFGGLWP